MTSALLVARVSTVEKGQDPENQLVPLRDVAHRLGWNVVGGLPLKLSAWGEKGAPPPPRRAPKGGGGPPPSPCGRSGPRRVGPGEDAHHIGSRGRDASAGLWAHVQGHCGGARSLGGRRTQARSCGGCDG